MGSRWQSISSPITAAVRRARRRTSSDSRTPGSPTSTCTTPTALLQRSGRKPFPRSRGAHVQPHDLVGRAKASGFDGLYTYDVVTWTGSTFRRICTQAHLAGLLCAPSVGPGYDARLATSDRVVRPRLHGQKYDRMWKTALGAEADLVTITSYNEWQEGRRSSPRRCRQTGRDTTERGGGRDGGRRAYLDATAGWTAKLREISRQ